MMAAQAGFAGAMKKQEQGEESPEDFAKISGRETVGFVAVLLAASPALRAQRLARGGLGGRARGIRLGGDEEGEQTEGDDGG
jgi:hypothetical protein